MYVPSKARGKELGQRADLPAGRRHQVPLVGRGGRARGQEEGGLGGADEESLRLGRSFNVVSCLHSVVNLAVVN